MKELSCPKCHGENTYCEGRLWICPDCSHEWSAFSPGPSLEGDNQQDNTVRDAHGTELKDGDSVSVIKDLKVKGSSSTIKVGQKVKNIKLVESDNGHNISCRVEGIGQMNLKSEFVKKI